MNVQEPIFEGILLVDKPSGITSHDIVDRLRKKLKMKKIGHAGTLDPLATGLMIMLIGKATKVSQFLISLDKSYEGEFLLGVETDSQDADGEVVQEKPIPAEVDEERGARDVRDQNVGASEKEVGGQQRVPHTPSRSVQGVRQEVARDVQKHRLPGVLDESPRACGAGGRCHSSWPSS